MYDCGERMYWKLRIPLLLVTLGILSGLYQRFPNVFLVNTNYFVRSAMFIGIVTAIFLIVEKTKVNERKVHFVVALVLIGLGYIVDRFL
ncbi:hypothetical protein ACFP7A_04085 [Sporolactobacillus kofuensis]|uniref:Uncharacterized protein n=1 Tax=Sporolactobacillus kofuensis TaxID=269672 RepID=A0ABW1WDY5_9BACL|nr:hypothetical protein [Sporolactobacillus kofuensis]MCO7174978.1 hypothetical protein [Sporolactobacillus kofuensis]